MHIAVVMVIAIVGITLLNGVSMEQASNLKMARIFGKICDVTNL